MPDVVVIGHLRRAYPTFVDPDKNKDIATEAGRYRACANIVSAFKSIRCPGCQGCTPLGDRGVTQNSLADLASTSQQSSVSVGRGVSCQNVSAEYHPGRFQAEAAFRGRVISGSGEQRDEALTRLYREIDVIVNDVLQVSGISDFAYLDGRETQECKFRNGWQDTFTEALESNCNFEKLCQLVLGEPEKQNDECPKYNDIGEIHEGRSIYNREMKNRAMPKLLYRISLALHARLLKARRGYSLHQDRDNNNPVVVRLGQDGKILKDARFHGGLHQAIEAMEVDKGVIIHPESCFLVQDAKSKVSASTVAVETGCKLDQTAVERNTIICPDRSAEFFKNKNRGSWVVKFVDNVSFLTSVKRLLQTIVYSVVWLVFFLVGDKSRADFYWGKMTYYISPVILAQREVAGANILRLVADPGFCDSESELRLYSEYLENIYVDENGVRHESYGLASRHVGEDCQEFTLEKVKEHVDFFISQHDTSGGRKTTWENCFAENANPAERFFERRLFGDEDCLKLDNYLWIAPTEDSGGKASCCAIDAGLFGYFEGVVYETAESIPELLEMLLKRTWKHAAQYFGRATMLEVLHMADPQSLYNALYNVLQRMAQMKNRQILDAISVVTETAERDRLFRLFHLRKAHAVRLLNTPYAPAKKGYWKRSVELIKNKCFPWPPTGVRQDMMPGSVRYCLREQYGQQRLVNLRKTEAYDGQGSAIIRPINYVDEENLDGNSSVEREVFPGVLRADSNRN